MGLTKKKFELLNVLPVEIVYKKVTILYIIKYYKSFFDVENIRKKRNP